MSAFWIRKRNFILAYILGIFLGGLFMAGVSFLIRGQINALVNGEEDTEKPSYTALALRVPLKKGDIIAKEDLINMKVDRDVENSALEEEILGQKLRINVHDNIPITCAMLGEDLAYYDEDRLYEFSFIKLPREINIGDFVDVRIRLHTGEDYVIISGKQVSSLEKEPSEPDMGFIELPLNESELLSISSAFVDTYLNELSEVYLDKYIDGKNQKKSTVNYPVNKDVAELFAANPNIINSPNIEENMAKRMSLDENLKKVVFENKKLLNYELGDASKDANVDDTSRASIADDKGN